MPHSLFLSGIRPGQCPPNIQSFPSQFGCSYDDDCPADHKCCEYLCGPVCVSPVFSKSQKCSHMKLLKLLLNLFWEWCKEEQCSFPFKSCIFQTFFFFLFFTFKRFKTVNIVWPFPSVKAECPDTYGRVGPCDDLCSDDKDCYEGRKCCSNGCGHQCTIPIIGEQSSKTSQMLNISKSHFQLTDFCLWWGSEARLL